MQKLGLEAERAVGFVRGQAGSPRSPRNSSSSGRQKQKASEPLLQCPCGAARCSYHSIVHLMEGDSRDFAQGVWLAAEEGCCQGLPAGAVSISQLDVHLTIRENCSRPALLPLLHVYSHCAKCAHATILQTTGPGDHNNERQHSSAASKSRLVVAVASAHKSSQGLHMHDQGVGQK